MIARLLRTSLGAALLLVAAMWGGAFAQSTSSSLSGIVKTPEGRPAEGAMVQARSDASGVVRTVVTQEDGRFQFDSLPPGTWIVVARSAEGALSETRTVNLTLQQQVRVELVVGAGLEEVVTVRAEAPLVEVDRTGGELRIDSARVGALPINGRNVTDLALLDASVRPTPPTQLTGERGSVFVINGQSGRSNSFLIDGLDNNDQVSGTAMNAWFSQQVIDQFVVLTHQFAPEFGRASGGVLNIVTARGSNEPKSEFFLQGTTGNWSEPPGIPASPPSTAERQTDRRYQTGFKVGGPIRKDRAFYFLAYEHGSEDLVVPFTGIDRDGIEGGRVYAPNRGDNLFLRTDVNLDASNFLMVRLSGDDRTTHQLNVGGVSTPESGFDLEERDLQLAASLTSVLSPTLVNELRFLAGDSTFEQSANSSQSGVERPSGIFGGNSLNHQERDESRFQIVDNLTRQMDRHTLKFGFDVTRSRTRLDVQFNPNGSFLYDTDAPFQPGDCGGIIFSQLLPPHCSEDSTKTCQTDADCLGLCVYEPVPCTGGMDGDGDGVLDEPGLLDTYPFVFSYIDGQPKATLDDTRIALFAQDQWQPSPKLSMDYGLRYDLSTYTLPPDTHVESPIPNGGAGRDYDNLAPRLGISYSPLGDDRLVIRGGAGVFYDKLVLGFPAVAAITSGTQIKLFFPQGFTVELTEDLVEAYGIDAIKAELFYLPQVALRFSTSPEIETPYAVQYNLGVEGAVGSHGAWSANLTRAVGYHLPLMRDLNPVVAVPFGQLPQHRDGINGSIAAITTEGRSWYSGLDLSWKWRSEDGWFATSYTLSRAEDLGPDPLKGGIYLPPNSDDLTSERGRSDFDRRHRLVVSGEAPLPWWGLSVSGLVQYMSGAPINVTTGLDGNVDGITSDRPAGVGRNTGQNTPLDSVNAVRDAVDLPRVSALEEPYFLQLDLRVTKPFALRQGKTTGALFLQVFNLLDRLNVGLVEGRVASQNFGNPIALAGPPRTVEVGFRVAF